MIAPDSDRYARCRPWIVWVMRVVLGALFIMSGLVKSIDLWGFVFKIEEYFTVWGIEQPRSLAVMISLGVSAAEFVLGCMLAVGAYRRTSVWLLLAMMAVMLPLTFYVYIAEPVADCGCFGDFWKLSNSATFYKNVVITAALCWLVTVNGKVKGLYHPYTQWMVGTACTLYVIAVALIGFNIQPMMDFRSFPVGRSLAAGDDELDDHAAEFVFVYEKAGEQRTFAMDSLPDESWTFVDRRIVSGNVDNDHTDLFVLDRGEDVTSEVIASEGEQLIVVLPQYNRADVSYTYAINELYRYMVSRGGSLVEIASIPDEEIEQWRDLSMARYPIYRSESTTLKELSRGVMSVVYLVDGHIRWKRSLSSIDVDSLDLKSGADAMVALDFDGLGLLMKLTAVLVAVLLLLLLVDRGRRWLKNTGNRKIQKNE